MHRAIYDPDGHLVALFMSDDHQLVPTQQQAATDYYRQFCSEFCFIREFPADYALTDIPQQST